MFGNASDEKNLHPGSLKENFFINLIEFFKQSVHLKNYSNSTFLFGKTKSPIFYCLKERKREFVRINLLVETFLLVCDILKQKTYSHTHSTYAGG